MNSILDRIAAYKRREVAELKSSCVAARLEEAARAAPAARGFEASLRQAARDGVGLIAEIKKASPSKGLIRHDFDPPALAKSYRAGGATCVSVLTDSPSFQGSCDYLCAVSAAVPLPLLRKDFLVDPWQIPESRSYGADCVLIILAMTEDSLAAELEAAAKDWGMDVLLEVHDESELERALRLKSKLIGINNRDLRTFEVSLETSRRLARMVPSECLVVSESGISSRSEIDDLAEFGVGAVLVGESLMRQDDVEQAVRQLLEIASPAGNQ